MAAPLLLIVDDDETDRGLVVRWLAGAYRVDEAGTVGDALDLLGRVTFEAVVVDLNLPGSTDWSSTLASLTEATSAPVVIFTGTEPAAKQPLRGLLLRAGADSVVVKGTNGAELVSALEDARDRHHREASKVSSRLASVEATLDRLAATFRELRESVDPLLDELRAGAGRRSDPILDEPTVSTAAPLAEPSGAGARPPGVLASLATWNRQRIGTALAGISVVGSLVGGLLRAAYVAWNGGADSAVEEPLVDERGLEAPADGVATLPDP